jgi:hypothetical protein
MRRRSARGLGSRAWISLSMNSLVRRVVTGVAGLSMVAASVIASTPFTMPDLPEQSVVTIARDKAAASLAARRQGSRVEVAGLRSESSSTFANPDGSWTLEQSVGPIRARKADSWVSIDRTLVRTADNALAPKASPASVEFSGGGRVPLARFSSGGKELTLSWPGKLPKPFLDGDTATYRDVMPGVDLRVRATDQGFGHDIVVRTPAAAADPALGRVTLNVATRGVRLTADQAGNLSGLDDAGQVIFHAPAPLMWDHGSPRTERRVGVELGAGTLTLLPDLTLLRDPKARFPLVIDPTYSGHSPHAGGSWSLVRRAFPDVAHWNLAPRDEDETYFGVARVGHAPDWPAQYLDRSLFKFDSAPLAGTRIKTATFRIWQAWKYANSCAEDAVDPMIVYQTGDIGSDTTWNNPPAGHGDLGTIRSTPKAGQSGCPPNWIGKDVWSAAQSAADAGAPAVVIGLEAGHEGGSGWKRFYSQAGTYRYQRVHNLTVAGVHTFYVFAGGPSVLVHNCNLFDGQGWEHVLKDHVEGSPGVVGDPDASLFHVPGGLRGADFTDTVGDYIEETIDRGVPRPNSPDPSGRPRSGTMIEAGFDYQVGMKQDGTPLYNVRVVVNPNGSIRTAFPF